MSARTTPPRGTSRPDRSRVALSRRLFRARSQGGFVLFAVLVLLLAGTSTARVAALGQDQYQIQLIGTGLQALATNDTGKVAVFSSRQGQGYIWQAGHTPIPLPAGARRGAQWPQDINNHDLVLVNTTAGSYLWQLGAAAMQRLKTDPEGGDASLPHYYGKVLDLNSLGQACGYRHRWERDNQQWFVSSFPALWKEASTQRLSVGNSSIRSWNEATALNDNGEVVGYEAKYVSATQPASIQGYWIKPGAGVLGTDLDYRFPQLPGCGPSYPTAINNQAGLSGLVAGVAYPLDGSPPHAWVWELEWYSPDLLESTYGTMVDLGVGFPTAVNDLGQVVGYERAAQSSTPSAPFIWDRSGGRRPLVLGSLTHAAPQDINNLGQIVGNSASGAWIASPPPALTALTLSPVTVAGGLPVTGKVTLSSAALTAVAVALSNTNPAAHLPGPPTVIVPAGAVSATFTLTTDAVSSKKTGMVTASLGGTSKSASLTVRPVGVKSITFSPASLVGGRGRTSQGTVTLEAPAGPGSLTVTLESLDPGAATPEPASLTVPAGGSSANFSAQTSLVSSKTVVGFKATVNGFAKTANLTLLPFLKGFSVNPASVTGGTAATGTLTFECPVPSGDVIVAVSSDRGAVAPLSVPVAAGKTSATFSLPTTPVAADTPVTLTATVEGASRTASLTVKAPALYAIAVSPKTVTGSTNATGSVTLTGLVAAGTGGVVVSLASNNASAAVPATVKVNEGAKTATFTITTTPVAADTPVTVTGTLAGVNKSTALTVKAPALYAIAVSPRMVTGGINATGSVTLTGLVAAGSGGVVVSLASNNASAVVPATVKVSEGAKMATFTLTTTPVAADTPVTVTGTLRGVNKSTALTVKAPALSAIAVSPAAVTGGNDATGSVTLSGVVAAGTGGVVVRLASNSAAASLPGSVTVAEGARSAPFAISTPTVAVDTPVTLSATLGSISRTAALAVKASLTPSFTLEPSSLLVASGAALSIRWIVSLGTSPADRVALFKVGKADAVWSAQTLGQSTGTLNLTAPTEELDVRDPTRSTWYEFRYLAGSDGTVLALSRKVFVMPRGLRVALQIDGVTEATFAAADGVSSQTEVVHVKEVNTKGQIVIRTLPGVRKWTDITLLQGISNSERLLAWRKMVEDGKIEEARKNVSLVVFTPDAVELAHWKLQAAWPNSLQITFVDPSTNSYTIEKMTLVHEGLSQP